MTTSHSGAALSIGVPVMSADGKRLGVIKETRADRFLVDVKWSPDYWLGTETIDNASDELVQLILTREGIGPAKLHNEVGGPGLGAGAEEFNGPAPLNRPPPVI